MADWLIVTHRKLNSNRQEAPEWDESPNRAILHADEYTFVPAYAFFFSLWWVYVFSSPSVIHYVHNVCYWLLFPPNRFNSMKQMVKWLQMQLKS